MRPVFVSMEDFGSMSVRRGTPKAFSPVGAGRLVLGKLALANAGREDVNVECRCDRQTARDYVAKPQREGDQRKDAALEEGR